MPAAPAVNGFSEQRIRPAEALGLTASIDLLALS
jgi:hypothetical protein